MSKFFHMRSLFGVVLVAAMALFVGCNDLEVFVPESYTYTEVIPGNNPTATGQFQIKQGGNNIAFGTLTVNGAPAGSKIVARACWVVYNTALDSVCIDLLDINGGGGSSTTEMFTTERVRFESGVHPNYVIGYSEFIQSPGEVFVYQDEAKESNLLFTIRMNH